MNFKETFCLFNYLLSSFKRLDEKILLNIEMFSQLNYFNLGMKTPFKRTDKENSVKIIFKKLLIN